MIDFRETYYWVLNIEVLPTLPSFKILKVLVMAISYLPLHSALPILLLHSFGDSIASIKLALLLGYPLSLEAINNISMPMVTKMSET